jgi:4-amino-4-deoxy-L-arabinose transferase-like glycosyltransferase
MIPAFEAPDEPFHLDYINFIIKNKELPNQYSKDKCVPREGHQPPLYYSINAFLGNLINNKTIDIKSIPNRNHSWNGGFAANLPLFNHLNDSIFATSGDKYMFYFLRIFSILLSALNLFYIFKISQIFFGDSKWNLLPIFLVATLPQFIFVSSIINNDNLANLLGTISVYYSLRIMESPMDKKNFILLGIAFGLGLITKKGVLALSPILAIIIFYTVLKNRPQFKQIAINSLVMLFIILCISGWFFVRNQQLYGDIFGVEMEKTTLSYQINAKSLFSSYFFTKFLSGLTDSFIGVFGWMSLGLPRFIYSFYIFIFIISLIGIFLYFKTNRFNDIKPLAAIAFAVSCLIAIVIYNLTFTQFQGRFMFSVISALAISATIGLKTMLSLIKDETVKKAILACLILAFIAIDIISIVQIQTFYYTLGNYS